MPDYFLPARNLLSRNTKKYGLPSQQSFHINDNPNPPANIVVFTQSALFSHPFFTFSPLYPRLFFTFPRYFR